MRFLERYFRTRTLYSFAIYSLVVGTAALIWLSVACQSPPTGSSPRPVHEVETKLANLVASIEAGIDPTIIAPRMTGRTQRASVAAAHS